MYANKFSTILVTVFLAGGAALTASAQTPQTPDTTQESKTTTTKTESKTTKESSRNRAENPDAKLTPSDQKFFEEAANGGMMEVALAKTAQQKAQNEQVKALAQKIEQDHTNANNELKSMAERKDLKMPTTMDPKHQAMMDKLSALSGAAFDKAYARQMVSDHKKDIAAFERESKDGVDSDLKAFASKTTPVLQEHLKMAQAAHQAASGKGASKK